MLYDAYFEDNKADWDISFLEVGAFTITALGVDLSGGFTAEKLTTLIKSSFAALVLEVDLLLKSSW